MKRLTTTVEEPEQIAYKGDFSRARTDLEEERSSVFERIHKLYGGSISKFFSALDQRKLPASEAVFARKYRVRP